MNATLCSTKTRRWLLAFVLVWAIVFSMLFMPGVILKSLSILLIIMYGFIELYKTPQFNHLRWNERAGWTLDGIDGGRHSAAVLPSSTVSSVISIIGFQTTLGKSYFALMPWEFGKTNYRQMCSILRWSTASK